MDAVGLVSPFPSYSLCGDHAVGVFRDIKTISPCVGYRREYGKVPVPFLGALEPANYDDYFLWRNTALSSLSRPRSAYLTNGGPASGTYLALTAWNKGCNPAFETCEAEVGTEASGWILVKLEDLATAADAKTQATIADIVDLMDRMKAATLAQAATWEAGVPHDAGPSPDSARDAATKPRPDGDPAPTIDSSVP